MTRQEAEKLLGGYATGTLTEAERQALFEAALADQALFDALADEEALRELLSDPRARRRLLEALAAPQPSLLTRLVEWSRRPLAWGVAGSLAVAAVMVIMLSPVYRSVTGRPPVPPAAPPTLETAQKLQPAAPPVPPPPAAAPQPHRTVLPPAAEPAAAPAVAEQLSPAEAQVAKAEPMAAPAAKPAVAGNVVGGVVGGVAAATAAHAESVVADARALFYGLAAEQREAAQTAFRARRAALEQETPRAAAAPGLRYTLMRLGPDGQYAEVDPDAAFVPSDSIRLSVEANLGGTLQLLAQDPAGAWREVQQVTLAPRSRLILPANDALALSTIARLRLLFSPAAVEELKLKGRQAPPPAVQKAADEKAVYAISPQPGPVCVDIELRRR